MGTISANGEREIGELIAKAMEKVGKEGVITIVVSTLKNIIPSYITSVYIFLSNHTCVGRSLRPSQLWICSPYCQFCQQFFGFEI